MGGDRYSFQSPPINFLYLAGSRSARTKCQPAVSLVTHDVAVHGASPDRTFLGSHRGVPGCNVGAVARVDADVAWPPHHVARASLGGGNVGAVELRAVRGPGDGDAVVCVHVVSESDAVPTCGGDATPDVGGANELACV